MERNNFVGEIEERDLAEYKKILKTVLNNQISIDEVKDLYDIVRKNKDLHILGYYINDNLVGTVTLNITTFASGREATIWDLAVYEEYRGLGIATKLMNRVEEIARTYDYVTKIWLFSGFHRKDAHGLYRKLGYDENRDKAFVKEL